jgi:hypothetical protein
MVQTAFSANNVKIIMMVAQSAPLKTQHHHQTQVGLRLASMVLFLE